MLSSLVHYYQDRFSACAWLAVSYIPPTPEPYDSETALAHRRSVAGNDVIGYQKFFCEPDAAVICEKNVSFLSLYTRFPIPCISFNRSDAVDALRSTASYN